MLIDLPAGRRAVYQRPKGDAPTIVFETGAGGDSADWAAVEDQVAGFAGTFRYDRAGRGRSDPVAGKRDAREMLDELCLLLDRTEVRGPCLLVGHSFGGLLMQMLADRMLQGAVRQEGLGLVLVDSMHPNQFEAMRALLPPPAADEPFAITRMRAFWTDGCRDWRANDEHIDLPLSMRQAGDVASLDDLPLAVLTSGQMQSVVGIPDALRERLHREWERLHVALSMLSGRGVHTRVFESRHYIMKDDPAAVVAAIRDVFERAGRGG